MILLDGGMGQELNRRGAKETPLWSAWALQHAPEMVAAVHADYVAAGADVLTVNSYATFRNRFEALGLDNQAPELTRVAGRLARQAADAADRHVLVAGSLPPLRNSYNPSPDASAAELLVEYTELVEGLDPYVDFYICETMGAVDEARAASEAARSTGKPVWVAFTLQGGSGSHMLDGTSFQTAIAAAPAEAYLLNCASPESITSALPVLIKAVAGSDYYTAQTGAYANAFQEMPQGWSIRDGDPLPSGRDDMDEQRHVEVTRRWLEMGATIVGGCCEIGPTHIAAMAAALR
ncbi:MAG: S-methylmethionine-dependent homocysteine/selenocysteine methylase [Candidatus Poriferisodalaceae bacterium]|jgi:S-methylmethionine-dependent homocysteine/selenocysteine methylase